MKSTFWRHLDRAGVGVLQLALCFLGACLVPGGIAGTAVPRDLFPLEGVDIGTAALPALGDLDADGKLDIVVGTFDGTLRYFQQTGTSDHAGSWFFTERVGLVNPLNGVDVGLFASPSLGDLDGDGDLDLLTGETDSDLHYFENTGTARSAWYVEQTGGNHPLSSVPGQTSNRPALGDLDGDGDLDLVVGNALGTLLTFLNSGTAEAPVFSLQTGTDNPFQGVDVGDGSAPAIFDIDRDGDPDVLVGRGDGDLVVFLNTGNAMAPLFVQQSSVLWPEAPSVTAFAFPALGDLDRDGDPDLLVGDFSGTTAFLENLGDPLAPHWVERSGSAHPLKGVSVSGHSASGVGDVDGDGDLDVVVGDSSGTVRYYQNNGLGENPLYQEKTGVGDNPLFGVNAPTTINGVILGDLDLDGDLDLVLGNGFGTLHYWENTGHATSANYVKRTGGDNPLDSIHVAGAITLCSGDLDQDGRLDLVVVSDQEGPPLLLHNRGPRGQVPVFLFTTVEGNPFAVCEDGPGIDGLALEDLDGDGDLDFVLRAGPGWTAPRFYENTGSVRDPLFREHTDGQNPFRLLKTEADGLFADYLSGITLGDLNQDGHPDVLIGNQPGELIYATLLPYGPAWRQALHHEQLPEGLPDGLGVESSASPAWADLDRDGDQDLLWGTFSGEVQLFENTGNAGCPSFTLRTGPGTWLDGVGVSQRAHPAPVDLDGDGDLDLLVSDGSAQGLSYFENVGTPRVPAWAHRVGAANPFDGIGDTALRIRVSFGDLDADGDQDAVLVWSEGGLTDMRFLENTGSRTAPQWAVHTVEADNPFSFITLANRAPLGLHVEAPWLWDADGDGDLDVCLGKGDGQFRFFRNWGTSNNPVFYEPSAMENPLYGVDVGSEGAPAAADLNGDGVCELYTGNSSAELRGFASTGIGSNPWMVPEPTSILAPSLVGQMSVLANSRPALVDIDTDGDLDVYIGQDDGTLQKHLNNGTPVVFYPSLSGYNESGIDIARLSSTAWGDLDRDGDQDLLLGGDSGQFRYYENTGSAAQPNLVRRLLQANPMDGEDVGTSSAPTLADMDADGDLDLFVGAGDGLIYYYQNQGDIRNPDLVAGPYNPLGGVDVIAVATPSVGDVDGDGDLDVVVGSATGALHYFENTGTPTTPHLVERNGSCNPYLGVSVTSGSAPGLGDVDGDGDPDLLLGDVNGHLGLYLNTRTHRSGYQRWAATHFDLPAESIQADLYADPDGDQAWNIWEYGGKLNPRSADSSSRPFLDETGLEDGLVLKIGTVGRDPGLRTWADFCDDVFFTGSSLRTVELPVIQVPSPTTIILKFEDPAMASPTRRFGRLRFGYAQ